MKTATVTPACLAAIILLLGLVISSPGFAQQELDSLLNSSHPTHWAYFRDPSQSKWYIANSAGVTYALGLNNSGHNAWVALAEQRGLAIPDFDAKRIYLSSQIDDLTPTRANLAISLVRGEADQYVAGNAPNQWAALIAGQSVNMDWYFFLVESTQTWYIIWIHGSDSTVLRLKLNASLDNYDWQNPLDGTDAGVAVATGARLKKEFFLEGGAWKVRFSLPDFVYTALAYNANPANRGYCYPQCVEFVRENLGLPAGRLYAKEYWTNPHTNYRNFAQGTSTRAPRPGDILVWSGDLNPNRPAGVCPASGCGHVAIVKSVNLHAGVLTRVDSNWDGLCSPLETTMTVTKNAAGQYSIGGTNAGFLLGWQSKDLTYFK